MTTRARKADDDRLIYSLAFRIWGSALACVTASDFGAGLERCVRTVRPVADQVRELAVAPVTPKA